MKTKCFVSYCSDDVTVVEELTNILIKIDSFEMFNTSTYKFGIPAGEDRAEIIRIALREADFLIAVITDSYLRSVICLSELSAFWYAGKKVIPVVYTQKGYQVLLDLFGKDIIYIDAVNAFQNRDNSTKAAQDFIKSLPVSTDVDEERISAFFENCKQSIPRRPFIDSGDEYENIFGYCFKYGVDRITNTTLSWEDIVSKLENKKDIYILSTTGENLINGLSTIFIPQALAKGINFHILLPNKHSQFCKDVAEIEAPNDSLGNMERLEKSFSNVIYLLKESINRAKESEDYSIGLSPLGKIEMGCAYTLLRETIILGVGEEDIWGWISLTIPPKRTNDGTPSLEVSGKINDNNFANLVHGHVSAIYSLAKKRGHLFNVELFNENAFFLEKDSAKSYWRELSIIAKNNMKEKSNDEYCDQQLIEVAACHPLNKKGEPSKEFTNRLDYAVQLFNNSDIESYIYVPGSLHKSNNIVDKYSLSLAGINYLIEKGIPKDRLFGDEMNEKYKKEEGVYNSADECFVASQIFLEGEFKTIHCICSPNQMLRKKLFYIAFGVLPMFHTVPEGAKSHDDIYEIFESIPDVIFNDHTWQSKNSKNGNRTRSERKV